MKKFGLFGYPLGHSFSARFFNEKFQRENIDATYDNYEIAEIAALSHIVESQPQLVGFNVTIPHKQAIVPLLHFISPEAAEIGAVNVVRVVRPAEGKIQLWGYNTDVIGFRESLRPLLHSHHQRALVLGTGGASKAVIHGLKQLGIHAQPVSREPKEGILTYSDITPDVIHHFHIIVNASPVGMYPKVDAAPDLPYSALTSKHILYDLVYNPTETVFMKKGREQGAVVKNGLEMLRLQAIAAWKIWNETPEADYSSAK